MAHVNTIVRLIHNEDEDEHHLALDRPQSKQTFPYPSMTLLIHKTLHCCPQLQTPPLIKEWGSDQKKTMQKIPHHTEHTIKRRPSSECALAKGKPYRPIVQ